MSKRLFGYIRVSSIDQNEGRQMDKLRVFFALVS